MSCLGVRQGNQRESDEKHPPAKTFNFQPGIRGAASPASYWLNFGVRELSHSLVASGTPALSPPHLTKVSHDSGFIDQYGPCISNHVLTTSTTIFQSNHLSRHSKGMRPILDDQLLRRWRR